METTRENGGSFAIDLNENEEGGGGGGGGGKAALKSYIALKDHSSGVSGGQEAGKGHVYVTGNGRNVNRDASVPPPPHSGGVVLDLEVLPGQLTDSCVISGVCGEHGGLNGFTESFGQEEPTMVELEGEAAAAGGGGGLGLTGTTAASCPAVLLGQVSGETGPQMRQHPVGESGGETPDSVDVAPGEEAADGGAVTGCISASLPAARPPCTGKHQPNCACTASVPCCPDVNMPNGDCSGYEAGTGFCQQAGLLSGPLLGKRLCDVDGEEVKVANGGFHIVNTARATCDWADSDGSPENNPDIHLDLGVRQENGAGSGGCLRGQSDCSGTSVSQCPGEDAPAPAHLPVPSNDSPIPGSSAKLPSPSPSTLSNGGSPLSEPNIRQDEEDFSDLSFPVRPQTLRTNPNLAVSLSCDATPLSPEDDGGFYFGDEGYMEDFRNVLEAGRRQSAPDNLPDLTEPSDGSDHKLMPKRFGIADFFTR